ncbi:MAG: transglutaminase domain-containing protein [Planctomycetes bacterium]|nr:transglutaminase domain-containing protein [Planctomycetota bacterium]
MPHANAACSFALAVSLAFTPILSAAAQTSSKEAQVPTLKFQDAPAAEAVKFQWCSPDDSYLKKLRTTFELDKVIAGKDSDYEKVQAICHWVRGRWEHNGNNEPKKSDPISILEEAAAGKRFRCVEYSVVLSGALNSLGISARVLGLMTKDVETRPSGAGHVVTEAYLRDQKKWIMVDGQWDAIPTLKDRPLNAVEFQAALAKKDPDLSVYSFSKIKSDRYFPWIAPYLYYFNARLDNSKFDQSPGLMLVPIGEKEPTVFQKKWPIKNMTHTHSVNSFYPTPN